MSKPIYIALLFKAFEYEDGINDVINLINTLLPNNTLVIEKYVTNGTVQRIVESLSNFLALYPNGDRITISTGTFALVNIVAYFESLGLSIPSFSLTATSPEIKLLKNVLTYAPFDQYSVMSNFMICTEYNLNKITVLYETNSPDDIFYQTYIQLVIHQAGLLNFPVSIDTLQVDKNYKFKNNSLIIILSDTKNLTNKFITPKFLNSIPISSCISLTDISEDITDIFGNVPSFVLVPFVLNYSTTTQLVYDSVTNKIKLFYGVYGFFDILYTLNAFSNTLLPLTIDNYLSTNAFTTFPPAFGYDLFDEKINGSLYGVYEAVFTKNTVIANEIIEFNKFNNGGIARLPESQSIFRSLGIAPFFPSKIFYCAEDYYKFYSKAGKLVLTRFDKSVTDYNGQTICISENLPCQFIFNYTNDGFFNSLSNLVSLSEPNSTVNPTMSKKIIIKYL